MCIFFSFVFFVHSYCVVFVSRFAVKIKHRNKYQLSLSISNLSVVFFQNFLQLLSFGFFFRLKEWHGDMLGRGDKSTEISPHKPSCTLKHVYTRTNRYQPATLAQSLTRIHTLHISHSDLQHQMSEANLYVCNNEHKNPPTDVFSHSFNPRHVICKHNHPNIHLRIHLHPYRTGMYRQHIDN